MEKNPNKATRQWWRYHGLPPSLAQLIGFQEVMGPQAKHDKQYLSNPCGHQRCPNFVWLVHLVRIKNYVLPMFGSPKMWGRGKINKEKNEEK